MAEEDNKPAPKEEEAEQEEEKLQADTDSADGISEGSQETKPQVPSEEEDLGNGVNDEVSTEEALDENTALSEALLSEAEEEQEEASAPPVAQETQDSELSDMNHAEEGFSPEVNDEGVEEEPVTRAQADTGPEREDEVIEADVPSLKEQADALKEEVANAQAGATALGDLDMLEYLEHLWMLYADFSISILSPLIPPISPPIIVTPAVNDDGRVERVFCISDEGFRLTTSRGEEAYVLGQSMFKYFNTIEKMIKLLVERLKTGGIDKDTEVRVAFLGFELGQRKAFESILNLEENVVVTNYDPGEWGDRFMKNILEMAERGYGLPPSSPRTKF